MLRGLIVAGLLLAFTSPAMADFTGNGAGFSIPDDDVLGASSDIQVNLAPNQFITEVSVELVGLNHTWVGDLNVQLTGPGGTIDLMFRTGDEEGDCCGDSSDLNGNYTFADTGDSWWLKADELANDEVIPSGSYGPTTTLGVPTSFASTFNGTTTNGTWTLKISDEAFDDIGSIAGWTLHIKTEPLTVFPDTFQIEIGNQDSGDLPEILFSDDLYLVIDPQFDTFRYQVVYTVEGTAPTETACVLDFTYESRTLNIVGTIEQDIELFNFVTGQYELVDSRLTSPTDTVVNVVPAGDPSRFIEPGTATVRARIRHENSLAFWVFVVTGLFLPFETSIDQVVWDITP